MHNVYELFLLRIASPKFTLHIMCICWTHFSQSWPL